MLCTGRRMPEIWTEQRKFSQEPVFAGTDNCHQGQHIVSPLLDFTKISRGHAARGIVNGKDIFSIRESNRAEQDEKKKERQNMTAANTGLGIDFRDLAANLTGNLVLPQDNAYDETRQLWNQRVDKRPAVLVRCASVEDVIHAVRWTGSHGLPLSVRAGGHDFGGRSLCDGGVVIDCS